MSVAATTIRDASAAASSADSSGPLDVLSYEACLNSSKGQLDKKRNDLPEYSGCLSVVPPDVFP